MTVDEGVELCRLLAPRVAVPVHYEGWSHFDRGLVAIERALGELGEGLPVTVVPIGERTSLDALLFGKRGSRR
jgi:L-ascorbate metabolism protein UlaG (beta-lactamase superfamily)